MNFEVASFWYGSPLSFVERACIQSFLDHGFVFHLYVLDQDIEVPDGVIVHDANDIYDGHGLEKLSKSRKRAAVYSDVLRIYLMEKTEYVWVDLDIYCVKPLDFQSEYLFGVVRRKWSMNNCVLRLPKESLALKLITNFYQSEVPLPFWLGQEKIKPIVEKYESGEDITLFDLPWTSTGPSVAAWALNVTGEIARGQHWHVYFPKDEFLSQDVDIDEYEADWVRFHHFQGGTRKRLLKEFSGVPPKGSYIDIICQRHGIEPMQHPIIG